MFLIVFQVYFINTGTLLVLIYVLQSVILFDIEYLSKEFNYTRIDLVSKCKSPIRIHQYRPISMYNFIYKVISKILFNKLKSWMRSVVLVDHNVFISFRAIQDKIIILHETFHYLTTSNHSSHVMALKLDMHKAYDQVDQNFLSQVLL